MIYLIRLGERKPVPEMIEILMQWWGWSGGFVLAEDDALEGLGWATEHRSNTLLTLREYGGSAHSVVPEVQDHSCPPADTYTTRNPTLS